MFLACKMISENGLKDEIQVVAVGVLNAMFRKTEVA